MSSEFRAWVAAKMIQEHRENIECDGVALLDAIGRLMRYRLRPPRWLADAFLKRTTLFENYERRTLDEVFGHVPPDERTRRTRQRWQHLLDPVYNALADAVRADPKRPIDIGLFEEIGDAFDIGKTLCRDLYDEAVRERGMQNLVELKRQLRSHEGTSGE